MTRHELATVVARRLAARVAAVAPKGLGAWMPAWELVDRPSAAFLEALHRWEVTDGQDERAEAALRADVNTTGDAVVAAWQEAARRWEEAGRPTTTTWPDPKPVEAGR